MKIHRAALVGLISAGFAAGMAVYFGGFPVAFENGNRPHIYAGHGANGGSAATQGSTTGGGSANTGNSTSDGIIPLRFVGNGSGATGRTDGSIPDGNGGVGGRSNGSARNDPFGGSAGIHDVFGANFLFMPSGFVGGPAVGGASGGAASGGDGGRTVTGGSGDSGNSGTRPGTFTDPGPQMGASPSGGAGGVNNGAHASSSAQGPNGANGDGAAGNSSGQGAAS